MKEGIISQSTNRHMSISVEGALRNAKPAKMKGWMTDDNGRDLSGKEVHAHFLKARFEGKRVLPMSDECENFNYETGCPGHPVYTVVHDWYFETGNG
jgi:hypothetical protein